ncbi:MAG: hypothetical protein WCG10_00010 [Chlamydiota bacterium]
MATCMLSSMRSVTYSNLSAMDIFNIFELDRPSRTDLMKSYKKRIGRILKRSLADIVELTTIAQNCIQPIPIFQRNHLSFKCAELKMHAFEEVFTNGTLSRSLFTQLDEHNLLSPDGSLRALPSQPLDRDLQDFLLKLDLLSNPAKPHLQVPAHECAFTVSMEDSSSAILPARSSYYNVHLENLQILNTYIAELEQAMASFETASVSKDQYQLLEKLSCAMKNQKTWEPIKRSFTDVLGKIDTIKTHTLPRYRLLRFELKKRLQYLYSPILEQATFYKNCYQKLSENPSDEKSIALLKTRLHSTDFEFPELMLCAPNTIYLEETQCIDEPPTLTVSTPFFGRLPMFCLFDLKEKAKTQSMHLVKKEIQYTQERGAQDLYRLQTIADTCIQTLLLKSNTQDEYKNASLTMQAFKQVFTLGTIPTSLFNQLKTANLIKDGRLSSHREAFYVSSETGSSLQGRTTYYTFFVQKLQNLNTYIQEIEKQISYHEKQGLIFKNFEKLEPTIKKISDHENFSMYFQTINYFRSPMQILKLVTLPPLKELQKELYTQLTRFKAHTLARADTLTAYYRSLSESSSTFSSLVNPLTLGIARATRYVWHPTTEELTQILTNKPYEDELLELSKSLEDA